MLTLDVVINSNVRQSPRLYAGGTCGNVLTILSYLGWKALPVARLDDDTASRRVLTDLKKWKVDVRFAKQQPGASTPIIVHEITRDRNGSPSHKFTWLCPQCGAWLPGYKPVLVQAALEVSMRLRNPKVFFMDRVSRAALTIAEASAKSGALVVFEPSGVGDPKLFRQALELTHVLKYAQERASAFATIVQNTGGPLLEIETRGRQGLRYIKRSAPSHVAKWHEMPAFTVASLKDAAGAGDWCTAGIVHALGQNGHSELAGASDTQIGSALRLGQAMAAWSCGFEGARGGMYSVGKRTFRAAVTSMLLNSKPSSPDAHETRSLVPAVNRAVRNICPACESRQQQTPIS
ncbi:MAG: carbohydrate kinase [Rubrivivax sp.]|nr:carbohydrate kinase [Pyrinomonadaceae bacterium]